MSWHIKVHSNPGSPIRGDYECPTDGRFEHTTVRDERGDPPATVACPSCGADSPWRPSAPVARVKLGEVVQGKVMEYPPEAVCLDTRPLAEGMPLSEWRSKQEAITRDINLRRHRAGRR